MTGIQVVSWVKPKAVLSLASEPSYCLACCSPLDCSARTLQGEIHYYTSAFPAGTVAVLRKITSHYVSVVHCNHTAEYRYVGTVVPRIWTEAGGREARSPPHGKKVCQEYHSSQPEVSAALERTCAVPRLLDYHIIRGMETGSSLSSDEDGATEGCSATDACSSVSDLLQEPQPSTSTSQPGTSTSQPHGKRRAQKRKRMSANEKFQSALLEQQAKLIAALETATQIEQGLRERQVATQEKLVDLFSKYFNK
ncbi:uncharacterized protein LOC119170446 isoform X4 [Rhipicephalus microplus]|uniref:uncharacterized protein LOC119170446 isoform X4 n=1 Tax=Rhipicephalus microplus TaxID=6941 RepID=UPI003F6DA39F